MTSSRSSMFGDKLRPHGTPKLASNGFVGDVFLDFSEPEGHPQRAVMEFFFCDDDYFLLWGVNFRCQFDVVAEEFWDDDDVEKTCTLVPDALTISTHLPILFWLANTWKNANGPSRGNKTIIETHIELQQTKNLKQLQKRNPEADTKLRFFDNFGYQYLY